MMLGHVVADHHYWSPWSEGSSRPGPWRTGSWWTSPWGRPTRPARSCIPPWGGPGCWSGPTRPLSCSWDVRIWGRKLFIEWWDLDLSEYSIFQLHLSRILSLIVYFYFSTWRRWGWWGSRNSPWSCGGHCRTLPSPVVRVSKNRKFLLHWRLHSALHQDREHHQSCQHLGKLVDMTGGIISLKFKVQITPI